MQDKIIYALCEPKTQEVKYVGSAYDIVQRFSAHINRDSSNLKLNRWITKLKRQQLQPILIELENCENNFITTGAEKKWIEYYSARGNKLFNTNLKGQDKNYKRGLNSILSIESNGKLSILASNNKFSVSEYANRLVNYAFEQKIKFHQDKSEAKSKINLL